MSMLKKTAALTVSAVLLLQPMTASAVKMCIRDRHSRRVYNMQACLTDE